MKTGALGLTLVLLAFAAPNAANAITALPTTTTYDWSGTCTDCTFNGSSTVYAQLVVTSDYVLGTDIGSDFVSLTYFGSDMLPGGFEITSSSLELSVTGGLPSSLPGPAAFVISDFDFTFESNLDAQNTWSISANAHGCAVGSFALVECDVGIQNSVAKAVPEPSTWAMMLLGFAGAGFLGYRARRRLA